jgi:RNA 3'-terminal phosphate cyclase (ATP)
VLNIDGSLGEGGGQIIRSSLALAAFTGTPVQIDNIRAGRKKPGLMRQHLTAVQAVAQVCQAEVDGAEIGSRRIVFRPGDVAEGDYEFCVGTAGSVTLVLQTVLPALLTAHGTSRLVFEGGTHNPWAPPFDFLEKAFLPLINRTGADVRATLQRPGFYPAGGGRFAVEVMPTAELRGFDLLERGRLRATRVRAIVANLPRHIADRECKAIRRETGWSGDCFSVEQRPDALGPGNVVIIELASENVTEVFTGFGQRGVRAERVAKQALQEADQYLQTQVPVGEYLADQLMLPLAISASQGGGGTYRTMALSRHATTHIDIVRQLLDVDIRVNRRSPDVCEVSILS